MIGNGKAFEDWGFPVEELAVADALMLRSYRWNLVLSITKYSRNALSIMGFVRSLLAWRVGIYYTDGSALLTPRFPLYVPVEVRVALNWVDNELIPHLKD